MVEGTHRGPNSGAIERAPVAYNGNGVTGNGHSIMRHSPYQPFDKGLSWLDLRVFYVRVSKCSIDESAPEFLTLNHVPLNPNTLLEVNGVRTTIHSDGASTLLRRDRLDKKSEEATFVSTDSLRMTGSLKFEVFNKDTLVLSGVLELCDNNGFLGESRTNGQKWSMSCESEITAGTGFLKGKQLVSPGAIPPIIEVYVAGSFMGSPIILSKTLHLTSKKKQTRQGMLNSIPEHEGTEELKDIPSQLALQTPYYSSGKPEINERYSHWYSETEFTDGEDGELSWFNAGVRVGVGIGLSICVGIGIGVGLLVRTYQGTTRNLRRRLL